MSFKNFLKSLNEGGVEGELFKTLFYSLFTSFLLFGILYYFKLKNIENFFDKSGFFLFFAILSYGFLCCSVRQVRAYKNFSCMNGMMIGMTIGMILGFLSGFFVGATNGMFVGGVFGIVVGIFFGVWKGSCCGIMGVMEGMMAGFMGGLMGAMSAVMMLNDNLKTATIIVFVVCGVILFGLNYMIYFETRESKREREEDQFLTIILSFILTIITIYLMVYGPRSFLFG